MLRKFGKIAKDAFKKKSEAMVTARLWVLCSLLGNYEFVRPSTRPKKNARKILYSWLEGYEPNDWKTSSFLRLLTESPLLLLFACREHLVYQITDIPALRAHFDAFSSFEHFRDIVVDCMDEVREIISSHLDIPCSPLHLFIKSKVEIIGNPFLDAFFLRLNSMLDIYHKRILDFAYKRPNTVAMSVIRSMATSKNPKQSLPLVPMPEYSGEVGETQGTTLDFRSFVPAHHMQTLEKAVSLALKNASATPSQAFLKVLDVFQCCGLSVSQTHAVKSLVQDLQSGTINAKEYKRRFKNLRNNCPHAFNLIQATVELVREQQRARIICELPSNIVSNQIKALEQSYGTTGMDQIPRNAVLFYYCHVCEGIYTLLRDFSASYINSYKMGLRDADVSYLTGEVFCGKEKHNHRGKCGEMPLKKIPLLGIYLFFCGKKIMLCPQPGCGLAMVVDPRQMIFNSFGPACYDCSFKLRIKRMDYNLKFMTRCVLCQSSPAQDKMFLFPFGAMICNRCNIQNPRLREHINTPEAMARCKSQEETSKEIISYRQMRRQIKQQRNQKQWTRQAKLSKARTRSNRK